MKYIRTRSGKIEDLDTMTFDSALPKENYIKFNAVKQADTIEELIMSGDLVRYDGLYMSWIEKDRGDEIRGIDMHLIPRKSVDMLWIPTGNDTECYPDFKLVASKEDDKGELELLWQNGKGQV